MPTASETTQLIEKNVTVAPLVLLSVVDHYNRIAKDTKKRVLGVLLGDNNGKSIRVANSFAIPFEEDEKNASVWFLDHNYVETMGDMFKKVNAKEKLIGWYHSGPKLRASDLQINELFKKYTPNPLLLVVDVHPKPVGIPTDAYIAVEEIKTTAPPLRKPLFTSHHLLRPRRQKRLVLSICSVTLEMLLLAVSLRALQISCSLCKACTSISTALPHISKRCWKMSCLSTTQF